VTPAVIETPALILPEPVGLQYTWLDAPNSRKVGRVGRRGTKTRFAFLAGVHGHGPGWEDGTPNSRASSRVWTSSGSPSRTATSRRSSGTKRSSRDSARSRTQGICTLNKTDHDVRLHGLGSLMLRSAEPDAIRSVRGVGKRLGGVIIDEAAWLALSTALKDIILPALLDNNGWLIITSTTNCGPDGDHDDEGRPMVPSYFNRLCGEIQRGERSKDWMEFTGTAYDNPVLDTKAIDELVKEYTPGSIALEQEVFAKILEPGVGLALPGLVESLHMVPAFSPPEHWTEWAGFDWGFHHPWTFGHYAADEDGAVYKRESLMGRLDLPAQLDAKVRAAGINPSKINVHAGPDVWRTRVSEKGKIKGEFTGPTVAEQLQSLGWRLIPAADARVAGLNNIRLYTYIDPKRPDVPSRFRWMDTVGNRQCLKQCRAMTLDPKNPEDALKVDADSGGRGGDDYYDETRYGLMARPIRAMAPPPADEQGRSLGYDYEKGRPRERETGDQAMEKLLGTPPSARAGRYRVPVRRG
jgi:hypothetical protein